MFSPMRRVLLVTGARVLNLDGNVDHPAEADILVIDGKIAVVQRDIDAALKAGNPPTELLGRAVDEVIDARGKLVVPGFVNAHYHSHDVLLRGCFDSMPLEQWFLVALPPAYPKRNEREVRARTLLGAVECLRSGITTVQDLATIYPYDAAHLDVALKAYDDVGIRCVFAIQVADVRGGESVPFWKEVVPEEMRESLSGAVEPFDQPVLDLLRHAIADHRGKHPRITWALGPSAPERCTEALLRGLADLSREEAIPVFTHIYESKATTLIARQEHSRDDGSLIAYLARCGLLNERLTLAHSVWMRPTEIELIRDAKANVVLNPVSNLCLRNGIAPIRLYADNGVNAALGCDNCSCSGCQNMFQAMKMYASLAAVSNPEPGGPSAVDAIAAATLNGARSIGMAGRVGAVKPGMVADFSIIDLSDPSFVPLNSAARQLVFSEAGRGVETVIVDGNVVVRNRKVVTIDEAALYAEVNELMKPLMRDVADVKKRVAKLTPYLDEAARRALAIDIGINRYIQP
jgi:5-methylthioadenosine/S-adenosylhomocysteine deaminase